MDFHTTHSVVTSYGKYLRTCYGICCRTKVAYSTTYTAVVLGLLLRQYVSYQFGVWAGQNHLVEHFRKVTKWNDYLIAAQV